jgi:hypothetical protein
MMRKDVVRMAREARLLRSETIGLDGYITETKPPIKELERFAALVAAHEREACGLIVLDNSDAEGICCTDDVLEAFRQRGKNT